ncbi:ketopantoate reductase PanE/ApbA superfamily protein [Streptococcus gordonii]|nr:ketopantoate reductase PanE/ApbA superfamily protein [Streptococcus gordonii]VTT26936.1 ketopantoate reductase PanE/ApbA superfamily protein [Streptococcus gordonii]
MRIAILGLGVIGTIYAYAFQKAGHQVEHVLRESKQSTAPNVMTVDLLDGRYVSKGENKQDTYAVHVAEAHAEFLSVCVMVL